MKREAIVFQIHLLQDINVLRGLALLAARETSAEIVFLCSPAFHKRDSLGTWRAELSQLAAMISGSVVLCDGPAAVLAVLQGRRGLVIAGSESDLPAHADAHHVFRIAPPDWLRVTLQHGLECVGFLQNREHVIAHGRNIGFAADVICAWSADPRMQSAMTAPSRAKTLVTGPSSLLQRAMPDEAHPPILGGLVCENLHSARLKASGNHGASFMTEFRDFCAAEAKAGRGLTLRPHPGGQYVLKNKVALPPNVVLNNLPIYRVALDRYAYGISAPSTVVLDMVMAGLPTGVWRDAAGVMDASLYAGLTAIHGTAGWIAFAEEARIRPGAILTRQAAYLDRLGIVTDPAEVYARFARLLAGGLARGAA